eukprot:TRINITY_DN23015_c0_g1_i1.p1 TRINITY_DN23015_c0_g1~~TRINITY_DN23015_c0_g1_i1.p1  ORF type:complete len:222 (+),score=17.64 TRINITY_DN23015_c0_g1_i1:124-789(+)
MASASAQLTPNEVSETPVNTRKCRFFGMGICTRGEACKFVHVAKEVRPPMNVFGEKMCTMHLTTEMCVDEKCDYAHRQDDLQKKHERPCRKGNCKRNSKGQRNTSRPSNPALLSAGALLHSLHHSSKCKARTEVSSLIGDSVDSMVSVPATQSFGNAATLGRSVKDVVVPRVCVHHRYRVVVKKTFIHVEHQDTSVIGMRRVATAPGSIADEFDMKRPRCN